MLTVVKQSTTYEDPSQNLGFVDTFIKCCGSTMLQNRGRIHANKFVTCTYDGHIITFCIDRDKDDIYSRLFIRILNDYQQTQSKYFIRHISLAATMTSLGEVDTIVFLDDNQNKNNMLDSLSQKSNSFTNQDQDQPAISTESKIIVCQQIQKNELEIQGTFSGNYVLFDIVSCDYNIFKSKPYKHIIYAI